MALYRKAGFRLIKPYYEVPDDFRNWRNFTS